MTKPLKSIVEMIHRAYDGLSARERQVADFILESPGEISMYPASELARLVGVSNSTVTRFVQRAGFESYEEMRLAAREARSWGSPLFLAPREGEGNGREGLIASFAEAEMAALGAALDGLAPALVDELAEALVAARRLGFLGFRNSHFFAGYARWQFIQFRPDTRLLPGPGETLAEGIADFGPEDMVVVVGVRRVVGTLSRALEALAGRGVPVLLIADPSARGMPALARWTVTCPVENPHVLDSYAGVLAVLRLLAVAAMRRAGKAGHDHLEWIETQHEALGEFD
ncbi:MurR/RpiR family transcriptional regulator [Limibaculum sp. FT325]|uniref:MurR/RpiR family transcriptional regulator n=1 Tax=Thermohalobaculum sediminis TaxID=2939436 RepID=UPI0020C0AAB9|nr:MurR/RpiR family transcriptional regulator [Limibaculum sediminis]MCL5776537.1 MurR/RpiR family transcriptional regulator [Limibaculum sediminis]